MMHYRQSYPRLATSCGEAGDLHGLTSSHPLIRLPRTLQYLCPPLRALDSYRYLMLLAKLDHKEEASSSKPTLLTGVFTPCSRPHSLKRWKTSTRLIWLAEIGLATAACGAANVDVSWESRPSRTVRHGWSRLIGITFTRTIIILFCFTGCHFSFDFTSSVGFVSALANLLGRPSKVGRAVMAHSWTLGNIF